jgi:hypothetical protein
MKTNYLASIPRDWTWWETYKSARGSDALHTFVDNVYVFLMKMKPGSFFRIEGGVKPENRDLFIKVCCIFMDEYRYMPGWTDYYEFNTDATEIRRVRLPVPEKKKNKKSVKETT